MLKKRAWTLLVASTLLGAPFAVWPQASSTSTSSSSASGTVPEDRLVDRYTPPAGSESNSKALVTGWRDGTEVKRTTTSPSGATTTTIYPPTGKRRWGT